ncbi:MULTISPECIES: ABC transporter substrate-binding protein [Serratia]|uniref:ABC transporter substrate-binding protein n=1 Tax=Serratia TaxID=613 RepID=UPI00062C300F|nr:MULTISPECIES: ABC transporter substrate-binding protein [Serratia]KKZ17157.1 ABC transporter substrate-binding protein [Serratia marcescens]MBE4973273.1 ABC transporter substrate-binding protein [Serratia sp. X3]MDI3199247.1 ABC transporter substrate-binding protein [Serratia ureilytica]UUW20328.1 ABC transporter substrate-binding protein [Serratia ureilytica]
MLSRIVWMLATWLLFCQVAHAEIHLTDVEGRQVTLTAPAQRAYIGFYYEDFLAVNGPESYQQVVAFSKSDWALRASQWARYQAALPRLAQLVDVGSLYNQSFDFERLLTTRPDLLILAKWQLDGFANYLPVLQQLNIPYIVVDFNQGVEVKLASIRLMGQAMGHAERAERLADEYRQSLEDTRRRIRQAQLPPPVTYIELGDKGPGEYGSSYGASIWGPLLQLAGADNIAAGVVGSPSPLRADYVLTQRPEVIFLAGGDWENMPNAVPMGYGTQAAPLQTRLTQYARRAGWPQLPAVKNQRLYALYHGGARTIYDFIFVQYLAKALYPTAFADVDPARNLAQFYHQYLPIEADGVFLQRWQGE